MTLKEAQKVLEQEGVSANSRTLKANFLTPHSITPSPLWNETMLQNHTVIEEIRKGYMLRGKVIRPSIVNVAVKSKNQSNQNNKMEEKKNE